MFPEPLVPKPTFNVLLQAKVVPPTGLPKVIAAPPTPLQCVRSATELTVDSGFIVTVKDVPLLEHPEGFFLTTSVPVYVPAAAPGETTSVIGLPGREVNPTFTNPAEIALAL